MSSPTQRSTRRPLDRSTIAVLALTLLFLASSLLVVGMGASAPASSPGHASRGPGAAIAPSTPVAAPTASPRPVTNAATHSTIDLYANNVSSGIVTPRYVNGPVGIAYNPINHLEMITGAESAAAALYDPATGFVQSFPQPLVNGTNLGPARQMGGVLFDPVNNQTFVTDQTGSTVLVYSTSALGVVTLHKVIPLWPRIQPLAMALDPKNNRLFVTDFNNSTVSVIDATADTWIADVGVGDGPASITYDPVQDTIYVADSTSDNITWINPVTLSTGFGIGSTFSVPNGPIAILYCPIQDIIWILESGYLTAFNSTSQATSVNYTLTSSAPTGLFWDSSQNELYAINAPTGSISVFNMSGISLVKGVPNFNRTKKAALTISTGGTPGLATFDSHLGEVDLLDLAANAIIRIPDSTQTVAGRISLGASPGGMAFDPINDAVIVTDTVSNRIYEVNSRNTTPGSVPVNRSFPVPGHPVDVAYDPDTGWLVVASNPGTVTAINPLNGTVNTTTHLGASYTLWNIVYAQHQLFVTGSSGYFFVLNSTTLVKTQAVQIGSGGPSNPRGLTYDPQNQNIYVALSGDNRIAVINSLTDHQTDTLPSSGTPFDVAYDSTGNQLFVVSSQSSTLTSMNPTSGTVLRTFQLQFLPGAITFAPVTDSVYVSNLRSNSLTVVDASYVDHPYNVAVGAYPGAMAYSPVTGDLFVADQASSTLSVLPLAAHGAAPFSVNLTLSPAVTDVTVPTTIAVRADLPAWALVYRFPQLPPGCTSANVPKLLCHPSTIGDTEPVSVTVANVAGDEVNLSTYLAVEPLPQILSFTATPSAITLSGAVELQVTVTGGVSPYKYSYSQVPLGCSAPSASVWNCTPLDQGTPFIVIATVTDAVHYTVSANANFTVNLTPQVVVTLSTNSTKVGEAVVLNVTVTHGTPPFTYSYAGLPGGCQSANAAVLTCIPNAAGVFKVKVTTVDSSNYIEVTTVTLTVLAPTSSSSSVGALLFVAIGLIAIVAVIAVALLLYRRSRPSRGAGAEPETPPEDVYGSTSAQLPRSRVEAVAAPGQPTQAPIAPRPEVSSTAPQYFSQPEEEAVEAPKAAPAPSEGPRPPVKCPHCGAMNQPWLINCRNCSWPLAET
jgi:YVTN family beta-propeller protein